MRLTLLVFLTFFDRLSFAQQSKKDNSPAKYDSLHLVVPHSEEANDYAAKIGQKWALLDLDKKLITSYKSDGVGEGTISGPSYASFIIPVKIGKKWGIVDQKGRELLPCLYDEIGKPYRYRSGKAQLIIPVSTGHKWGILNGRYKLITPIIYDKPVLVMQGLLIPVTMNGLVGVIDTVGNLIIPCSYDYVKFDNWRFIEVVKDKEMGLITRKGKMLASPRYGNISYLDRSFDQGRDWFQILQEKKTGLMDSTGKEVIPCVYDAIYLKKLGNYIAKKGSKWGLISSTNQELISFNYDNIAEVGITGNDTNMYYNATLNGNHGLLNSKGQIILNFEYAGIDRDINTKNPDNDLIKAWKTSGTGVITLKGKIILPFEYKQIYDSPGNYILLDNDDKFGLSDLNGQTLLPCDYDGIHEVQGADYYVIVKDKKISIVTRYGKFIFKNAFDDFSVFPGFSDFILVKKGQKYGLLDRDAKLAYPCIYKRITYMDKDFVFEKF
jgi:hypothetical protein